MRTFFAGLFFVVLIGTAGADDQALRISVPLSVSSIPILELDGSTVEGGTIKASVYTDHSIALADFIRGNVDVLMTGFTQGLAAYAGNENIRLLVTPVWGVSSLMVRDHALKGIGDLAGKSVVVPFAKSPLDLQLRALLESVGILDKVLIQYGPTQQAIPLLLAGRVDGIAVPEPFGSDLEAQGKAKRLFTFQAQWAEMTGGDPRSPQVSLFVMKGYADAHPALMKGLVGAVMEKIGGLADPQGAALSYASRFNVGREVLRKGLENTLFGIPPFGDALWLCADYSKRIGLEGLDDKLFLSY